MLTYSRWRRALGVGIAVGLLLAAPPTAAAAAPQPAGLPPQAAAGSVGTVQVTLITGDIVDVQRLADGRYLANARPGRKTVGNVPVTFQTVSTPAGDLYVLPSDAGAAVATGVLDRELFNVRRLVEEGHADGQDRQLPVIVQFSDATAPRAMTPQTQANTLDGRAHALPATADVHALTSIGAAAARLDKSHIGSFWGAVRPGPPAGRQAAPSLSCGVKHIWLDGKVHVTLDQSVPQIGAPAAWQAGLDGTGVTIAILDTGVDPTHPDLTGRISGAQSFIPGSDSTVDHFGHGTHVASIIAGSGAASGGKYRGVAPGANLLIGKVLGDDGSGDDSWIIAGMQWAAHSGARAVSMSLGGGPSDGTDPMSEAVNELTQETGTLFVIAAGNAGPSPRTVATPGAAAAALTVGAVDKSDEIAGFSSRGPLTISGQLKPDITAPGVNIIAARAAGTSMGTPIDQYYTQASGTSMATPHVTGSVAILAQEHPDWRATQLKAVLMDSAKVLPGLTGYDEGSGRVDVAAAIHQEVTASPASVDFGLLHSPQPAPVGTTETLTNNGSAAVTAELSVTLHDPAGNPTSGRISVTPATVTIPAGGTADVTVSFDGTTGPTGAYSGILAAVDPATGAEVAHLAVGGYLSPPGHNLRLSATPPAGWGTDRMADWSWWIVVRVDAPQDIIVVPRTVEPYDVWVPDGVYAVTTEFQHVDPTLGDFAVTQLLDPEVVVKGANQEVDLDATAAHRVTVQTPKPTDVRSVSQTMVRGTTYGGWYGLSWGVSAGLYGRQTLRVSPTRPVTVGTVRYLAGIEATEATVQLRVLGDGAPELEPVYPNYQFTAPTLDANRRVELVDVGSGSADEIAKAGVRGRLALVTVPWRSGAWVNATVEPVNAALARLRDAGALAAVVAVDVGPVTWCGPNLYDDHTGVDCPQALPLPAVRLGAGEAAALRAYAGSRPVPVALFARSTPSYNYQLHLTTTTLGDPYRVSDDQLATVEASYHTSVPRDYGRVTYSIDPDGAATGTYAMLPGPHRWTEYVGPVSDRVLWYSILAATDVRDREHLTGPITWSEQGLRVYPRTGRQRADWGTPLGLGAPRLAQDVLNGPVAPALPFYDGCLLCRTGDVLFALPTRTHGAGQWGDNILLASLFKPGAATWHLYRDGQEVTSPASFGGVWAMSQYPDPARYRLTLHASPGLFPDGTDITTSWEFTSQQPTGNEAVPGFECLGQGGPDPTAAKPYLCRAERMPMLDWAVGPVLGLDNAAVAPGAGRFRVDVYHQIGAPDIPVRDLQVQVSYDHGAHWRPAPVSRDGDGQYEVALTYPRVGAAGATVSLRGEARDADGNRVEQTLLDLYQLAPRTPD